MSALKSVRIVDPLVGKIFQNAAMRHSEQISFSTAQLSQICGATLRQLQLWDEEGILVPGRVTGNRRRYTQDQVTQACKLSKVRNLRAFYFKSGLARKIMEHDGPIEIINTAKVIEGVLCIPGKANRP